MATSIVKWASVLGSRLRRREPRPERLDRHRERVVVREATRVSPAPALRILQRRQLEERAIVPLLGELAELVALGGARRLAKLEERLERRRRAQHDFRLSQRFGRALAGLGPSAKPRDVVKQIEPIGAGVVRQRIEELVG